MPTVGNRARAFVNVAAYDAACAALPATFKTIQWRGCHVWKVGTPDSFKLFAIGVPSPDADNLARITLKVGADMLPFLMERDGVGSAPHLRQGGWVQITCGRDVGDDDIAAYLGQSHRLMVQALPKKVREPLGLTGLEDG